MTMTDHSPLESPNVSAAGFSEIEAVVDRVRAGELTDEDAFAAVTRIVHERAAEAAARTYQKPWG